MCPFASPNVKEYFIPLLCCIHYYCSLNLLHIELMPRPHELSCHYQT